MATGDITFGARTALANVSRLHSIATGTAQAFGEIETLGEIATSIHLTVPISASAVLGTYDIYLVESQDGIEWTDNIDPANAGDVFNKIADAKFLHSSHTVYEATNRTESKIHFQVSNYNTAKYIGFVLSNSSGQTIPATGADGDSVAYTVS